MDMLVSLYDTIDHSRRRKELQSEGFRFVRAMAGDASLVRAFIAGEFPGAESWADEASAALTHQPESCFIAIKENAIVGLSCYDATAKGMIGPVGVSKSYRRKGIAGVLLDLCFQGMRDAGYAYGVIGWVSSPEFYRKNCRAVAIENSSPGIYGRKVRPPQAGHE